MNRGSESCDEPSRWPLSPPHPNGQDRDQRSRAYTNRDHDIDQATPPVHPGDAPCPFRQKRTPPLDIRDGLPRVQDIVRTFTHAPCPKHTPINHVLPNKFILDRPVFGAVGCACTRYGVNVMPVNLISLGQALENEWQSHKVANVGGTTLKIFRMGGTPLPEECHPDYTEIFIVLEGEMRLITDGTPEILREGDMRLIPPSTPHSVLAGSRGVLMIIDNEHPVQTTDKDDCSIPAP